MRVERRAIDADGTFRKPVMTLVGFDNNFSGADLTPPLRKLSAGCAESHPYSVIVRTLSFVAGDAHLPRRPIDLVDLNSVVVERIDQAFALQALHALVMVNADLSQSLGSSQFL
ncbi:hypothetical protein D3C80_813100 [compost metagenome]